MTTNMDTWFAADGKKGTYDSFFSNAMALADVEASDFVNVYSGLGHILAKQYVHVPDTADNPLSRAFMSEAINYGDVVEDIYLNGATVYAGNFKADADFALGFKDSTFSTQYSTFNSFKTIATSLSKMNIDRASRDGAVADQMGNGLLATLMSAYVKNLETEVGKVLPSTISSALYCGDSTGVDYDKQRLAIRDAITDMSKLSPTYTQANWAEGKANSVYVIASKNYWAKLSYDLNGKYHPEYCGFEDLKKLLGIDIIEIAVDDIATPITAAEISAYTDPEGNHWDTPVAVGAAKPDFIICDTRYFRINPCQDYYNMGVQRNEGGMFSNFFLHSVRGLSAQKYRKAVRGYIGVSP